MGIIIIIVLVACVAGMIGQAITITSTFMAFKEMSKYLSPEEKVELVKHMRDKDKKGSD